jgi:hypothetical protein
MATTANAQRTLALVARRRLADGALVEERVLAREAGLHPELVRRLIRLGALEPSGGTRAAPLFPREAAMRLAKTTRLRSDLGLNWAGALLVVELLERIDELEAQLR